MTARGFETSCGGRDGSMAGGIPHCVFVCLLDAWSQHRLCRSSFECCGRRLNELVEVGAIDRENEAGVRAELACTKYKRLHTCFGDLFATVC
jgi:hypothetical protein